MIETTEGKPTYEELENKVENILKTLIGMDTEKAEKILKHCLHNVKKVSTVTNTQQIELKSYLL